MSNWTKDYKESKEVRGSYRRDYVRIQFIHRSLHMTQRPSVIGCLLFYNFLKNYVYCTELRWVLQLLFF